MKQNIETRKFKFEIERYKKSKDNKEKKKAYRKPYLHNHTYWVVTLLYLLANCKRLVNERKRKTEKRSHAENCILLPLLCRVLFL